MNRAAPAQICQTMDPNGLKQVPKLFTDGPHGGTGRTDGTDGTPELQKIRVSQYNAWTTPQKTNVGNR